MISTDAVWRLDYFIMAVSGELVPLQCEVMVKVALA